MSKANPARACVGKVLKARPELADALPESAIDRVMRKARKANKIEDDKVAGLKKHLNHFFGELLTQSEAELAPMKAKPQSTKKAEAPATTTTTPPATKTPVEPESTPEGQETQSDAVPADIAIQLDDIKFSSRQIAGPNKGKMVKKIIIDDLGTVHNVGDTTGHPNYVKMFLPKYLKNGKPNVAKMVEDGWYWGSVTKNDDGSYSFIDGATKGWPHDGKVDDYSGPKSKKSMAPAEEKVNHRGRNYTKTDGVWRNNDSKDPTKPITNGEIIKEFEAKLKLQNAPKPEPKPEKPADKKPELTEAAKKLLTKEKEAMESQEAEQDSLDSMEESPEDVDVSSFKGDKRITIKGKEFVQTKDGKWWRDKNGILEPLTKQSLIDNLNGIVNPKADGDRVVLAGRLYVKKNGPWHDVEKGRPVLEQSLQEGKTIPKNPGDQKKDWWRDKEKLNETLEKLPALKEDESAGERRIKIGDKWIEVPEGVSVESIKDGDAYKIAHTGNPPITIERSNKPVERRKSDKARAKKTFYKTHEYYDNNEFSPTSGQPWDSKTMKQGETDEAKVTLDPDEDAGLQNLVLVDSAANNKSKSTKTKTFWREGSPDGPVLDSVKDAKLIEAVSKQWLESNPPLTSDDVKAGISKVVKDAADRAEKESQRIKDLETSKTPDAAVSGFKGRGELSVAQQNAKADYLRNEIKKISGKEDQKLLGKNAGELEQIRDTMVADRVIESMKADNPKFTDNDAKIVRAFIEGRRLEERSTFDALGDVKWKQMIARIGKDIDISAEEREANAKLDAKMEPAPKDAKGDPKWLAQLTEGERGLYTEFKKKLNKGFLNLDPLGHAADLIHNGVVKFIDFARRMVSKFGEKIKSVLGDIWEHMKGALEAARKTSEVGSIGSKSTEEMRKRHYSKILVEGDDGKSPVEDKKPLNKITLGKYSKSRIVGRGDEFDKIARSMVESKAEAYKNAAREAGTEYADTTYIGWDSDRHLGFDTDGGDRYEVEVRSGPEIDGEYYYYLFEKNNSEEKYIDSIGNELPAKYIPEVNSRGDYAPSSTSRDKAWLADNPKSAAELRAQGRIREDGSIDRNEKPQQINGEWIERPFYKTSENNKDVRYVDDGDPQSTERGNLYMDATGLRLAADIVQTMGRQAKDVASFAKSLTDKLGDWIKPHIKPLWEAFKRGVHKIQAYLKKLAFPPEVMEALSNPNARHSGIPVTGVESAKNANELLNMAKGDAAEAMRAIVRDNPKIAEALKDITVKKTEGAYFDGNEIGIYQSSDLDRTITHEVAHSFLDKAIDEVPGFKDAISGIIKDVEERLSNSIHNKEAMRTSDAIRMARELYGEFERKLPFSQWMAKNQTSLVKGSGFGEGQWRTPWMHAYALSGPHEFLAAAMSDAKFRSYLKSFKTEKNGSGVTGWQKFINAIRKMFGASVKDESMLDRVMSEINQVIKKQEYKPGKYNRNYIASNQSFSEKLGQKAAPQSTDGETIQREFDNNNSKFRHNKSVTSRIAEAINSAWESAVDNAMSLLRRINPRLAVPVAEYARERAVELADYENSVQAGWAVVRKLPREAERERLRAYVMGDIAGERAIIRKHAGEAGVKAYDSLRESLKETYKKLHKAGVRFPMMSNYLPISLKQGAYPELVDILVKEGIKDSVIDALTKGKGEEIAGMSSLEAAHALQDALQAHYFIKSKSWFSKQRSKVLGNQDLFDKIEHLYEPLHETVRHYGQKAADSIARSRIFGIDAAKDLRAWVHGELAEGAEPITKSSTMGNVVSDLITENKISGEDLVKVKHTLATLLNHIPDHGVVAAIKSANIPLAIGNFFSAVKQPGTELVKGMFVNGVLPALSGLVDLFSRTGYTFKDIDFMNPEVTIGAGEDPMRRMNKFLMSWSGFRKADLAPVLVFVNGAIRKLQGMNRADAIREVSRYQDAYQGESMSAASRQLVDDIMEGNIKTENAKRYVFQKLAEFRPIGIESMPLLSLKSDSATRLIYNLKGWGVYQLAGARDSVFENLRSGDPKRISEGLTNLAFLVGGLTVAGAAGDSLVSWLLGKRVDFPDAVQDNWLKFILASKYSTEKLTESGDLKGFVLNYMNTPLLSTADALFKDAVKAARDDEASFMDQLGQDKAVYRAVPLGIGTFYWNRISDMGREERGKYIEERLEGTSRKLVDEIKQLHRSSAKRTLTHAEKGRAQSLARWNVIKRYHIALAAEAAKSGDYDESTAQISTLEALSKSNPYAWIVGSRRAEAYLKRAEKKKQAEKP